MMVGKFHGRLEVGYINGREWSVLNLNKKFGFRLDSGEDVVPEHLFRTDFASIPRFFWRILPPVGNGSRARYGLPAVVHDWLYKTGRIEGRECSKDLADSIFLAGMKAVDVEPWKRKVMYLAVRYFGLWAWKNCRGSE